MADWLLNPSNHTEETENHTSRRWMFTAMFIESPRFPDKWRDIVSAMVWIPKGDTTYYGVVQFRRTCIPSQEPLLKGDFVQFHRIGCKNYRIQSDELMKHPDARWWIIPTLTRKHRDSKK